ncbi:RsmB/NOP family class I SAM-dependent RNA methyltransferase [Thalassiella azotivora]
MSERRSGPRRRSVTAPAARSRAADPVRRTAYEVLRAVAEDDAYANLVLPAALRRERLSGRDAALATELTYGTLRGRGLYDAVLAVCVDRPLDAVDPRLLDVLRLGVHQLLATRVPAHAAVDQSVALARSVAGGGAGGFVNAVLRRVAARDRAGWLEELAGDGDETTALGVRTSHPDWVVRAVRGALVAHGRSPGETAAVLEANNLPPRVTLAALPGLADPDELAAGAAGEAADDRAVADGQPSATDRPGRWSPVSVVLAGGDPGALEAVRRGRARVQDEGSQLAALALAAAPVEGRDAAWLDLCAGPGGKAALLAAVAAGRGARLTAVEVQPHRAGLVRSALADVPGDPRVRVGDGRDVGQDHPAAFDRVLVDVPCTGLGALRRRPEARWRRTPQDLAGLGPLQRDLLASALDAVRPGGVVAYVTCSPHVAETTTVVQDVLRRRDDVEVLDAPEWLETAAGRPVPGAAGAVLADAASRGRGTGTGDDAGPRCVQLWPDLHGTDAMFVALLRRHAVA